MDKNQIMEAIKGMTVLELAELVKELEEEFGVSAAAPMARSRSTCSRWTCRSRRRRRRPNLTLFWQTLVIRRLRLSRLSERSPALA